MDRELQRLAGELRRETCPPKVLETVARRLERLAGRERRSRFRAAAVAAGLVLCGTVAFWQWQTRRDAQRQAAWVQSAPVDRAQIAEQAGGALAYLGHILLQASARSEHVILKEAVPPLRNGFQTANKIVNRI
jgi:ABC-type transporter Mla MlaB component